MQTICTSTEMFYNTLTPLKENISTAVKRPRIAHPPCSVQWRFLLFFLSLSLAPTWPFLLNFLFYLVFIHSLFFSRSDISVLLAESWQPSFFLTILPTLWGGSTTSSPGLATSTALWDQEGTKVKVKLMSNRSMSWRQGWMIWRLTWRVRLNTECLCLQCITDLLLLEKNWRRWNIHYYMFGIQCLNFVVGRSLLYGLNLSFGRWDIGRRIYKNVLF